MPQATLDELFDLDIQEANLESPEFKEAGPASFSNFCSFRCPHGEQD